MQRHNESDLPMGMEVFKYQTEITELKNTTTKLRCSREGFNSRVDGMGERMGERQGLWNSSSWRGQKKKKWNEKSRQLKGF